MNVPTPQHPLPRFPRAYAHTFFVLWLLMLAGLVATSNGQTTFIKADNTDAMNLASSYTANSSVPGTTDTIQFDSTLTAARTAVLGGSLSINAITVPTNYAQRFTFGSTTGASLTIGAGGITKTNTTQGLYFSCSVALGANQTWNIAGNTLVFNGPTPAITDNGHNVNVTGGGVLELRPAAALACGANWTINCNQVNINAATADVTFGGANTFKTLFILIGTAEGSSFPADTNAATSSNFGNASSGTIIFGLNTTTPATLIYNGNTASTPKTFTYDARSTGTATINVSTAGQTLTLTSTLLLSNGSSQTSDKSWNFGGAGNLTLSGPVTNASGSSFNIGINKNDAGTLTLAGTNTYSGNTNINGGTLALTGTGSIANTPLMSLTGGTTFDVSGLSSGTFTLGSGQTLASSSASAAALKGNVNASQGTLSMSVNGTAPAFTIGSGTLTVSSSTVFHVDSGIGTPGTYPLIVATTGGRVTGTLPPITLFRATGYLQINAAGGLDLVVQTTDVLNYYVSPNGSDTTGDGTRGNPWQSVTMARDALHSLGAQSGDVNVYLRGGRYEITNTIAFTSADSGTNGHYIVYQPFPGESVTISGGKRVTGWAQVPGKSYWVASVPTTSGFPNYFRQLYVNGIRAERARSNWLPGSKFFWVTGGTTYNYSTASTGLTQVDGIAFATTAGLKTYTNISDLRLLHIYHFKVDEFPIGSITTNGSNVCVALQQPYCQARYAYGSGAFGPTDQFMIVGAFEELDEPGEWYLNRSTQQVYYYPNSFENMNTAAVYAPVVERLVDLSGDSTSNKLQNIRFQNLTFEHSNWFLTRDTYIGGGEAEGLLGVSGTGSVYANIEVPGAIKATNTSGIQFIGNTIQHQGTCGIHLYEGTQDTLIQGNLFFDLTGAAVLNGHQYGITTLCTNTMVVNNVIRNTGSDFAGSTFLDNLGGNGFQALYNDMADCQYDGFHQHNGISSLAANTLGHGATTIGYNRMAMALSGARYDVEDGGYIYTSGVWPNSTFIGNDINEMNQPSGLWTFGFYQDYDSYGLLWKDNVMRNWYPGIKGGNWQGCDKAEWPDDLMYNTYTDATIYLATGLTTFSNYVQITNGIWPAAAQTIINAAGLQPGYTHLLDRVHTGINLAKGKTTSSSSGTSQAAVDWNYGTAWHSDATDTSPWWTVDLGAPYVIQRLELVPRTDLSEPAARSNFQVQASNDATFTTYTALAEQNAVPFAYKAVNLRNSWVKYINNPAGYRYLRVKTTSGSTLGLSEFQVYGYTPQVVSSQFVWDAGAAGNVTDGGGEWNAANHWWNGSADQAWTGSNDAIIGTKGGAAGNITVTGTSPQVTSLTFNPASSGTYTLTGSAIQLVGNGSSIITANANATVSNNLTSSGPLVKMGVGALTLSGSNSFGGDVFVVAGKIVLGNALVLQSSAWDTTGASSAVGLDVTGLTSVTLGGLKGGVNLATGITGYGSVTSLNLNVAGSGNATYSGAISNGAAGMSLTKDGSGTQAVSAATTYTGPTVVNAGTLNLTGAYASSSFSIANGAVLGLDSGTGTTDYAAATFSGSGTLSKSDTGTAQWGTSSARFALSAGALIDVSAGTFVGSSSGNENWTANFSDLNVASGAIFDGAEGNIRVNLITGTGVVKTGYNGAGYLKFTIGVANGSGTVSNVISNSTTTGNLAKEGTGTIALVATNTYTGSTTISAGRLNVNGSINSTAALSVASGATLGGTGTVASPSTITGTVSPGTSGVGTLTFSGTLSFGAASHLAWGLGTNTTTGDYLTAAATTVTAGAKIDLSFADTGSTVSFLDPFWGTTRTFPVLAATSLTGTFTLGTIGTDSSGRNPSWIGTFALQQTATGVNLIWTPNAAWTGTPWQQWQLTNFSANWNSATAALNANPSHDGITNLMKYAMLLNPNASVTIPQSATLNGSGFDFTYTKNKAASDATFIVEWSGTLNGTDWSTTGLSAPTILSDNGVTQQIKVTVPAGSGVARRFVRLRVSHP